jgi:hypothetical protein
MRSRDRLKHEKRERTEKQGAGEETVTMRPFGKDVVAVEQRWWSERSRMRALCKIEGRIVFRGHPLPCPNAGVKY